MLISWILCLALIFNAQSRGIGKQKMARSVTMLREAQTIRTGLRLMQWNGAFGFQRNESGTHWMMRQTIWMML